MYLSGTQDLLADGLSRHFATDLKWELCSLVENSIFAQWGALTWELFASQANTKCSLFSSRGVQGQCSPLFLPVSWVLQKFQQKKAMSHSDCAQMAQAVLVPRSLAYVSLAGHQHSSHPGSLDSGEMAESNISTQKHFALWLGIWMGIGPRTFLFQKHISHSYSCQRTLPENVI